MQDPFVSGYVASTISDLMYLKECAKTCREQRHVGIKQHCKDLGGSIEKGSLWGGVEGGGGCLENDHSMLVSLLNTNPKPKP